MDTLIVVRLSLQAAVAAYWGAPPFELPARIQQTLREGITPMRLARTCMAAAILAGTVLIAALSAQAGNLRFKPPQQVQAACAAAGGSYRAPGEAGVYGCEFFDGPVIACGGRGQSARTCETGAPRTILNPILVRGNAGGGAEPRIY